MVPTIWLLIADACARRTWALLEAGTQPCHFVVAVNYALLHVFLLLCFERRSSAKLVQSQNSAELLFGSDVLTGDDV